MLKNQKQYYMYFTPYDFIYKWRAADWDSASGLGCVCMGKGGGVHMFFHLGIQPIYMNKL